MQRIFIAFFIICLSFSGKPYTWEILGPDSVNVTNVCFGVALPYWMICTDGGVFYSVDIAVEIIQEKKEQLQFSVFSAMNSIYVKHSADKFTGEIRVYNLLGQCMDAQSYSNSPSVMHRFQANDNGIFMVSIRTEQGVYSRKIYMQ